MSRFRVEVLKTEGSMMTGRTLGEDLSYREANSLYLSYQGRRKGDRKIQGTPNLMRQDDENFVEVEE